MNTGPPPSGISWHMPLVALLSLGAFLILALIAAAGPISAFDHGTQMLVHSARLPVLDPAMHAVSRLGERDALMALVALGVAVLWRPSRRWAVALPFLMMGTGLLQLVAKWAVDRPRPNLDAWGFPSGHVLSLTVFFGVMTYVLALETSGRSRRWLGYAGCAAIVLAVAFSRLYLDAHWISDVAGGFVLGIAYLLTAIWGLEVLARRNDAVRLGEVLRLESEAQVQLADDEGRRADVDPVVEPI